MEPGRFCLQPEFSYHSRLCHPDHQEDPLFDPHRDAECVPTPASLLKSSEEVMAELIRSMKRTCAEGHFGSTIVVSKENLDAAITVLQQKGLYILHTYNDGNNIGILFLPREPAHVKGLPSEDGSPNCQCY